MVTATRLGYLVAMLARLANWQRVGLVTLLASMCLSELVGASQVARIEFVGEAQIAPSLTLDGTVVGGLSAISWDAGRDVYYSVSDDPGNHGPPRFYTLKIDLTGGRLQCGGIEVLASTVLQAPDGERYGHMTVDLEGVALGESETLFVSSEGQIERGSPPFVAEFDLQGGFVRELDLPAGYLALDDPKRGQRHNLGFESLTLTPSGKYLVVATENALAQDGPAVDLDQRSPARILRFDVSSGRTAGEYLYWTEPIARPTTVDGGQQKAGLVDLVALDDTTFLALERSFSLGPGNSIQLFEMSLEGADEISQLKSASPLGVESAQPASKTLLLDLSELGIRLENIEGLGFGPTLPDGRRTLVMVGDDNFNPQLQTTQFLAFALSFEPVDIAAVQGMGHRSPYENQWVRGVEGRVSAVEPKDQGGFWIQSKPDDTAAQSSGLFIQAGAVGSEVSPGNSVRVDGRILEEGKVGSLTVTTLRSSTIEIVDATTSIPPAVQLGRSGQSIPSEVIDNDNFEFFDPQFDGIDFWERLEGVRVVVDQPLVVGPSNRFGDLVVVADEGRSAGIRTVSGGVLFRPGDSNPERLTLDARRVDSDIVANVGDHFDGRVSGIVTYDHGVYRLRVTNPLPELIVQASDIEVSPLEPDPGRLTVGTFNLFNLGPRARPERIEALGRFVVDNLRSPDILAVQEVQDDSGTKDNGIVSANESFMTLIRSIEGAGGPTYDYYQIDPSDNADGGYPGANIRVGFLINPDRVGVDSAGDLGANTAARITSNQNGLSIEPNPARVAPDHLAFNGSTDRFSASRKPLAVEIRFEGRKIFLINCHLVSRRADTGLFGSVQPPRRTSEDQRAQQAQVLSDFVGELLASDPKAKVVLLGDLNELEFGSPLRILAATDLRNLVESIPVGERYSYVHRGNSQMLDHILVSRSLVSKSEIDIVHGNADLAYGRGVSDHDPILIRLDFRNSP